MLAGAGGYDTREVIHAAAEMQKAGAQGLLSVTPYYNKPTPEGLYQHYKAISDSTTLPIIVYNVPGRTGCNIDAATLTRLATLPNIVGVKEASGNMTQMAEICRAVPPAFLVLSGDDALTLPLMAIGGRGIISVASNEAPAEMVQMVEAAERGDFATAKHWHDKLLPLMQINFVESSPGPVKFAMAAMGLCEEAFRLPMVPPRARFAGSKCSRSCATSACRSPPEPARREPGGDHFDTVCRRIGCRQSGRTRGVLRAAAAARQRHRPRG